MRKTFLAISVLLTSYQAMAQTSANNPQFNYAEAGYVQFEIDDIDEVKPAGITISVAKQFDQFFVAGQYMRAADETNQNYGISEPGFEVDERANMELTTTRYELGAGYIWDVSDGATIDLMVAYGNLDATADVDFTAEIRYMDIDGNPILETVSDSYSESADENYFSAAARYILNVNDFVLKGSVGAERFDTDGADTEFVYRVEAGYFVTEAASVNLGYTGGADYSVVALTARYHF